MAAGPTGSLSYCCHRVRAAEEARSTSRHLKARPWQMQLNILEVRYLHWCAEALIRFLFFSFFFLLFFFTYRVNCVFDLGQVWCSDSGVRFGSRELDGGVGD